MPLELQKIIKNLPPVKTWGVFKKLGKRNAREFLFSKNIPVHIQYQLFNLALQTEDHVTYRTLKNFTDKRYLNGLKDFQSFDFPIMILAPSKDVIFPQQMIEAIELLLEGKIVYIEDRNHLVPF
jgi:hypothetical protein